MLGLSNDARRSIGKVATRFERRLIDLAESFAESEGVSIIHPEHVCVAVESLAGDNATFLQTLLDAKGEEHVERRAG